MGHTDKGLADLPDHHLQSRLEKLVKEYDVLVREVAKVTVKAAHVRETIQGIVEEMESRGLM